MQFQPLVPGAMQCTRQGSEMEEAVHVKSREQPVPPSPAALGRILSQTVFKSLIYITIPRDIMTVI